LSIEKSAFGQKKRKPLKQCLVVFRFALPNRHHAPSCFLKLLLLPLVTKPIRLQFRGPIIELRFRRLALAAPMRMPKTPMYEYDRAPLPEHQIWPARQIARVKAITVSCCMKQATNGPFWTGILRANCLHYSAPLFARSRVSHVVALVASQSGI
jgi:hypothetical protein